MAPTAPRRRRGDGTLRSQALAPSRHCRGALAAVLVCLLAWPTEGSAQAPDGSAGRPHGDAVDHVLPRPVVARMVQQQVPGGSGNSLQRGGQSGGRSGQPERQQEETPPLPTEEPPVPAQEPPVLEQEPPVPAEEHPFPDEESVEEVPIVSAKEPSISKKAHSVAKKSPPALAKAPPVLVQTSSVLEEGSGDTPSDEISPEIAANQQLDGTTRESGVVECNFGTGEQVTLCAYSNSKGPPLRWQTSTGRSSNWLGGPPADATGAEDGGYAFFETSEKVDRRSDAINRGSALLESALQSRTPPEGQCVQFDYQLLGRSAHQLRLKLHRITEGERDGYPADYSGDTVLIDGSREPAGLWQTAELLYTFPGQHTLVFEAIPCPSRNAPTCSSEYRGHIALDSVRLSEQGCIGHCTFEGGPCRWSQDERDDDFQWLRGRSSPSETTGPRADHGSEVFGGTSGGYMYVDSGRSRRPGDRARLLSPQLPATDDGRPLCFRFWIYMFGPGVGTLRVLLLASDDRGEGEPRELWHLSGDSGRQWHQSRVTVSSVVPFRVRTTRS